MSPPAAAVAHDRCIHAEDEHDPVRHTERLNDLKERADKHDQQWDALTGPEGALTKVLQRLTSVEVKLALYAGGAAFAGALLVEVVKHGIFSAARAAGVAP